MVERVVARAVQIEWDAADQVQNYVFDTLGILLKDLHHLGGGDRLNGAAGEKSAVVVGDERDIDHGHGLFQREVCLGILGHTDYLPALRCEPLALRLGGEAWAVDGDYSPRGMGRDAVLRNHLERKAPQMGAVWIGRADVVDLRPFIKT